MNRPLNAAPSDAKSSRAFTRIAPYYEELMRSVPYNMWISYLKLIWANVDAKPMDVLEVCCGTGKLCRMLTKDGYNVTGVDLSEDMIRQAKLRADDEGLSIRFETQDAAEMRVEGLFDAAFSFFDSFNYITEPARCLAAIERTAGHLKQGAPLLMDLNTEFAFTQKMFDQSESSKGASVRYNWRSKWDEAARLCRVEMDFWAAGEHFHEVHVQRAHSMQEITGWMEAAGLANVRFYDAYTLDPPRARSDRVHALAIRS